MSLEPLTDDLWIADHPHRMPGGIDLPTRMTVVRLPSGDVWLHSPIPIDDALAGQLESIGPIAHVVAPSRMHDLFTAAAMSRWPNANLWTSPTLPDAHPDWKVVGTLAGGPPDAWGGVLLAQHIDRAPRVDEVVFLHVPSRTLIVTDLVFNLHDSPNWQSRLLLTVVGAKDRFAMSRSWRWLFSKDRVATRQSLESVLAWDFDRVVMCHGRVLAVGGPAALRDTVDAVLGSPA